MASISLIDKIIKQQLQDAVLKIKADYAEIRAELTTGTRVFFQGETPDMIAEPQMSGYFIRVLVNGSWGIVTFTDITELDKKISQAVDFAKIQGKGNVLFKNPSVVKGFAEIFPKKDFRDVPLSEKVKLVKSYNNILLKGVPGIQTTTIGYSDQVLTKYFVNSAGAKILQSRPYTRLGYQSVAIHGDVVEMYRGSAGKVGGFEVVEGLEDDMLDVSKNAVELAKTSKVKAGIYTVILDPYMAGTFAHEAFGHLSEADHQYENPQLLKQMQIGTKLGSSIVNISDDPTIFEGWGSYKFDDEGIEAKPVDLLSSGEIIGRLHSLETATVLNEEPNGHARADGYSSKPIIRMSNTYFTKGQGRFDTLLKDTKKGLLVVNWMAGMTAMENFTFTGMYGVEIENGKLGKKVRGVKLMGNVFETLKNINAVTEDIALDIGTCGKDGQSMPVGSGGGYVRITNITVGGA